MTEYRIVEDFPAYRVGDDGTVWTCWKRGVERKFYLSDEWRQLQTCPDGGGYLTISLNNGNGITKTLRPHRLVLELFVGACPDGMEACHCNGDKADCRLSNLRWDTHANNNRERKVHGTMPEGERHYRSRITDSQAAEIKRLKSNGATGKAISRILGISIHIVYRVARGKGWNHVTDKAVGESVS